MLIDGCIDEQYTMDLGGSFYLVLPYRVSSGWTNEVPLKRVIGQVYGALLSSSVVLDKDKRRRTESTCYIKNKFLWKNYEDFALTLLLPLGLSTARNYQKTYN
jgi:hypothetical protein